MSTGASSGGSVWSTIPLDDVKTLHAEMSAGMNLQLKELEGLDTKTALLLTPLGVLLGLGVVATGHSLTSGSSTSTSTPTISSTATDLLYAALAALVAGIVLGVIAYWPRSIRAVPNPSGLFPGFVGAPIALLLGAEIEAIGRVYPRLARVHRRKLWWTFGEFVALLVGAVLLAVGYAVQVWGI